MDGLSESDLALMREVVTDAMLARPGDTLMEYSIFDGDYTEHIVEGEWTKSPFTNARYVRTKCFIHNVSYNIPAHVLAHFALRLDDNRESRILKDVGQERLARCMELAHRAVRIHDRKVTMAIGYPTGGVREVKDDLFEDIHIVVEDARPTMGRFIQAMDWAEAPDQVLAELRRVAADG